MRKVLIILVSFLFLEACAETTVLLGPALTVGSSGNVLQAGFSYGSNMAVKKVTGKTPGEHASSYIKEKKEEKKIRKEMVSYLQSHIEIIRNKLASKN